MMGSPAIAAFVALAAFWALLLYGWAVDELTPRRVGLFLLLWLAGRIGLPYVPYAPVQAMFSSYVAVLDIGLVFMIFKGDVPLN